MHQADSPVSIDQSQKSGTHSRVVPQVDYLSLLDNRRIEYRSPAGSNGQRQWSSREVNP